MNSLQIIGIKSPQIIGFGDSVYNMLSKGLKLTNIELKENDIIAITSKVVSMEQKDSVKLDLIKPSDAAIELANGSKLDPRVVQLILNESEGQIYGYVYHAILAKTKYGLSSNAGIDLSNCPEGYALLLPRNPDQFAEKIRERIKNDFGVNVGVIITDSRTIPLRRGTMAVAIGISGFNPVIDERGNVDLYGYVMAISTRAIADSAATAANIVMGETNEQTPFSIIRGLSLDYMAKPSMLDVQMPEDQCLYFAPLMDLIKKNKNCE